MHVADALETCNPYIEIYINNRKVGKSRTIFRDCNPTFSELFKIPISVNGESYPRVKVKVFHSVIGGSEFLGSVYLNSEELMNDIDEIVWDGNYELLDPYSKSGEINHIGRIYIRGALCREYITEQTEYRISDIITELMKEEPKPTYMTAPTLPPIIRGTAHLKIKAGYDLKIGDITSSDAYGIVKLGTAIISKTAIIQSLYPQFAFKTQFDINTQIFNLPRLQVVIMDKDTLTKDDFLGKGIIDLYSAITDPEVTHGAFIILTDNKHRAPMKNPVRGFILVQLLFTHKTNIYNPIFASAPPNIGEKKQGRMRISVLGAEGLRAADKLGSSDAYCKIKWAGGVKLTTKVITSLNPIWNETVEFPLAYLLNIVIIYI